MTIEYLGGKRIGSVMFFCAKIGFSRIVIALTMLALTFLIAVPSTSFAKTTDPRALQILKGVDNLFRSETTKGKATMTIHNSRFTRTLKLRTWSEGTDNFIVMVDMPRIDRGTATLMVDDLVYNYLPKTDRVIKVPSSLMDDGWMGSDITNNDLVESNTFTDDYVCEVIRDDRVEQSLQCIPDEDSAIIWDKVVLHVSPKTGLPTVEEYYDDLGDLVRVKKFSDVQEVGGKLTPMRIVATNELVEGQYTVFQYDSLVFDTPIARNFFSLTNIRRIR